MLVIKTYHETCKNLDAHETRKSYDALSQKMQGKENICERI